MSQGHVLSLALAMALGCQPREAPGPAAAPAPAAEAHTEAEAEPEPEPETELRCRALRRASRLAFPEASGATYVSGAQEPHILIVADSGRRGQLSRVHLDTLAIEATWYLPLDAAASDDLEGLSMIGDTLYAITSSGWVRHFRARADGSGWVLIRAAYPVAGRDRATRRFLCSAGTRINCGLNYEGLCLRQGATPGPACAGFIASKSEGVLYCVTLDEEGQLAVDPRRSIAVAGGEALSGCHFEPDGDGLWAGSNLFGANRVYRITGWRDPARARVHSLGSMASGFAEAIAVAPGGRIYRFSDMSGATSLVDAYVCE